MANDSVTALKNRMDDVYNTIAEGGDTRPRCLVQLHLVDNTTISLWLMSAEEFAECEQAHRSELQQTPSILTLQDDAGPDSDYLFGISNKGLLYRIRKNRVSEMGTGEWSTRSSRASGAPKSSTKSTGTQKFHGSRG